ncbi:MAG TPA: ABC transporter ATP-binding protein [Bosea sp. (in: a-proteobacteria)]
MFEARNLGMRYAVGGQDLAALQGVDLSLPRGSFTTIVGRSGCGKTTLLRLLAGLAEPSEGELRFEGGGRPRIAYVFQEPRLMPWLSVARNVGFGLVGRLGKEALAARVAEALRLVGLAGFSEAMPEQLSGGMAQRVAIARALVLEPDLLLLDEPFGALDAFTRRSLQMELVEIWRQRGTTIVFVTHDVEEAVLLGQAVAELSEGRLVGLHRVDLPYPRDATDPALVAHRRAVLERLLAAGPTSTRKENPSCVS